MDITGANLCLVVVMIFSNHVTVLGDEGVCDDTPCLNGGQCIDLSYPGGPQEFKCSCREGFKGLTCQKHIDPCVEEPCFNGGSCVPNGEHYHCVCTDGFEGKNCDVSKAVRETCGDKPCGAHGVCEMVNDDFICECFPGYQGPRCETAEPEVEAEAEAKEEGKDTERSSATGAEDEKTKEATWDIRNMLISLFVIFLLFVVVLLLLCIHCSRVYKRRTEIENIRKARRAAGLEPPPMPGWLETSNKLCNDCMCYLCMTPNKDSSEYILMAPRNMDHRVRTQPPEALYTADNVGDEFYAYEDPNDYRLRGNPYTPNVNENKGYRNHNRNYKNSSIRYYRRPPQPSPVKAPGRRYYKNRQMVPVSYDDDGEEDDDSDEDDDSEGDPLIRDRAPRGLLPGFEKVSPDKQYRRQGQSAAPKNVPAVRENRRLIKTKHSRALSPKFPFRPEVSTYYEKKCPAPSVDNLEMEQSEYYEACDGTDENDYESSDEEGDGHKMHFEDDGYMSTSRLSESDAGGRDRDPQSMQLYTELASKKYQARQQQKALQVPMQGIQWPVGVVAPPPPRRPSREVQVVQYDEDDHADDAEYGESRYAYGANHSQGVSRYTSECGELRQIKSILKKNKPCPRPKETVIHVRSGIVDGQNRPIIYRDASRNYGSESTRNKVEYTQNGNRNPHYHDQEKARYTRRQPHPPTHPPPMYEDVVYS